MSRKEKKRKEKKRKEKKRKEKKRKEKKRKEKKRKEKKRKEKKRKEKKRKEKKKKRKEKKRKEKKRKEKKRKEKEKKRKERKEKKKKRKESESRKEKKRKESEQSDAGWSLDSPLGRLWVSCLAYADDIMVFARTEMTLSAEFGKIGLEVALVNCVSLPWSPSLEFIGNVFDFCGHSGKSAEHRQHEANGVIRLWAPILTNLSLPISERMNAFRVSVASSALWLSGCWTLTKTQSSKLGSWSARLLRRMGSCRRRPESSVVWISRSSVCCINTATLVTWRD